jgi:hypothetical protein
MSDAERVRRDWWVRPRVVLPVIGSLLLLVALLTPESDDGRVGDARLSAHLAGPLGARALREVAGRLGWRVVLRDSTPTPTGTPGTTIHAVLDPTLPVTPAQAHRYLEAVRAGDALLLVLGDHGALADSLGVMHSRTGGVLEIPASDSMGCRRRGRDFTPSLWPDGRVHLYALRWTRGRPEGAASMANVTMGPLESSARREESAAGFPYGRGRIAVVADPDLLRNDVIRRCEWGADVVAVRLVEWLGGGGERPRGTLEFDEFHHGHGPRASVAGVTRRFLATHPLGRTLLQLGLAALVLILALAPRPLPPPARPRAERRDPLEQVDALAHAYQQVGATRTATVRLLHGVRSRVEHASGARRTQGDDAFLHQVLAADPARASDVALVRRALQPGDDRTSLPDVGAALRRIEASLTTTSLPA